MGVAASHLSASPVVFAATLHHDLLPSAVVCNNRPSSCASPYPRPAISSGPASPIRPAPARVSDHTPLRRSSLRPLRCRNRRAPPVSSPKGPGSPPPLRSTPHRHRRPGVHSPRPAPARIATGGFRPSTPTCSAALGGAAGHHWGGCASPSAALHALCPAVIGRRPCPDQFVPTLDRRTASLLSPGRLGRPGSRPCRRRDWPLSMERYCSAAPVVTAAGHVRSSSN